MMLRRNLLVGCLLLVVAVIGVVQAQDDTTATEVDATAIIESLATSSPDPIAIDGHFSLVSTGVVATEMEIRKPDGEAKFTVMVYRNVENQIIKLTFERDDGRTWNVPNPEDWSMKDIVMFRVIEQVNQGALDPVGGE